MKAEISAVDLQPSEIPDMVVPDTNFLVNFFYLFACEKQKLCYFIPYSFILFVPKLLSS